MDSTDPIPCPKCQQTASPLERIRHHHAVCSNCGSYLVQDSLGWRKGIGRDTDQLTLPELSQLRKARGSFRRRAS